MGIDFEAAGGHRVHSVVARPRCARPPDSQPVILLYVAVAALYGVAAWLRSAARAAHRCSAVPPSR